MVAPPWFQLPPTGYGGIEAVVADLVAQLVRRGHEVHLVAAGPHRTAAQHHHASFDRPPSGRLGESFPEVIHAAYAAEVLAGLDLDLVHDHSLAGVLSARGRPVPTLVTMHGPATGDYGRIIGLLGRTVRLVAISDAQRASAPGLPWIGRVHNGIDVASYPLVTDKDDYLLWLGRFTRDKGPHVAIDVARAVGRRIVLAGKLIEPDEQAFFRAEIEPRLGPGVEYVGEADAVRKRQLFSRARCLVFPLQWDEPFGIVMAEAMACGTPVVALRRGSVPEVVEHEVAGFVVDSVEELCAAVDTCDDLDPKACREVASRRFDLSVMADGYERAYHALLTGRPTTVSAPAAPSVTRRAPISA
jgi:glycosyltransferase involved in cell wall biosynthesis